MRGLDVRERERIVQMMGDLSEEQHSKVGALIERHQPALLDGSAEDIQVSLLPLIHRGVTRARLYVCAGPVSRRLHTRGAA